MMTWESVSEKISLNSKNTQEETIKILIKIVENVINNPKNPKVRTLQKNNATISTKLLSVQGGTECLKLIGFQEMQTFYTLPFDVSLEKLNVIRNNLKEFKTRQTEYYETPSTSCDNSVKEPVIKKIILSPLVLTCKNIFLRRIESYSHSVLAYSSKDLQERARNVIPVKTLENDAQVRLRLLQQQAKKNKQDIDISIQDMMILELLNWFKNDFFTWVDSPDCSKCGEKTKISHMSQDPNLLVYTDRVEMHHCLTCGALTPFPRYNDLNILLETRSGRCGEWANTFTLLCISLGWDARFVVDEGDHVWTEVFSFAQKRWLHCDPCENICDTPLIYESGWGKQISYVMAYSPEEVQDVTWRYTSNHKEVLKRRRNCTERELVDLLVKLRNERQKDISESKRKYLTRRTLNELVELMLEKKPSDTDKQGRTSGDVDWRVSRGETQVNTSFVWEIDDDFISDKITLLYSPSTNKYEFNNNSKSLKIVSGWNSGVYFSENVFLKKEMDWNMVYLCRKGEKVFSTNAFGGLREVTITATLKKGNGDVGWQHAQLFRQKSDCDDYPFKVTFTFKNN